MGDARPKLLIVGGGFAGACLAVRLGSKHISDFDVTLVNRSDFFEVSFANARSVVEPGLVDKVLWPFKDMKPHGTFIQGEVVELTDSTAKLKDGRTLDFDFAAIATGSSYAVGKASEKALTTDSRKTELQELAARVKASSRVTIVGGGPLGVELAGEILTDLPDVQVTLVQSGSQLLPSLPAKLGAAADRWLRDKGCKVVMTDRLDVPAGASGGPYTGTTRGGVAVDCDVLLTATGITVNTPFMQPHLADALDQHSRIKVESTLQVVGHPRLFALGDVTDVPEEKLAFLAAQQANLVAANLAALAAEAGNAVQGATSNKLRSWKPSMGIQVMFVSVGRDYGVGRIGWLALTGWVPTRLKSRNITGFVDRYRQQLLLQP